MIAAGRRARARCCRGPGAARGVGLRRAARPTAGARGEAKKGNWDLAVARLTKAARARTPTTSSYKIALENARIQASRFHYDEARKHLAADELDKAAEELQIATNYDPSNKSAVGRPGDRAGRRSAKREEEQATASRVRRDEGARPGAPACRCPCSRRAARCRSRSSSPTRACRRSSSAWASSPGVNIDLRRGLPRQALVRRPLRRHLRGGARPDHLREPPLLQGAGPEHGHHRARVAREAQDLRREPRPDLLPRERRGQRDAAAHQEPGRDHRRPSATRAWAPSPSSGTPDELALAARIIEANDKAQGRGDGRGADPRGQPEQPEELRHRAVELRRRRRPSRRPAPRARLAAGFTNVRAHLLSSLNLADFVVSIPSTLLARFLQTESTRARSWRRPACARPRARRPASGSAPRCRSRSRRSPAHPGGRPDLRARDVLPVPERRREPGADAQGQRRRRRSSWRSRPSSARSATTGTSAARATRSSSRRS